MKLRTKLLVDSVGILLAALLVSAAILMAAGWRGTCGALTDYAVAEQQILARHFGMELNRREVEQRAGEANESLALYLFRQLSGNVGEDTWYVLGKKDGSYLQNNSKLNLEKAHNFLYTWPTEDGDDRMRAGILRDNGRYYCLVTERDSYYYDYSVSLVREVTDTMESLLFQMALCAVVCVVILIAAACVLSILVRRAMGPVEELRRGAEAIAAGEYDNRLPVSGTDEIGSLALSFNHMAQAVESHIGQVEARAQERQMLLNALAHEMRTPVTAISGYAHALRYAKLSQAQTEEATEFVNRESRRLERLATKLTELMTLERQTIERKPISARDLAAELERILGVQDGLQVKISGEGTVRADQDLLLSLMTNLVDNGRKAGANQIEVSITPAEIKVSDNGGGIPAEELARICQPFYRVDKARSREGFGFGLALCQKIVELHDGEMTFESQVGQGTTVKIMFSE